MKTVVRKAWSVALLVSLGLFGGGCVSYPLSTSRQPISLHKTADFEFVKFGQPSRSEVESKLGNPDQYFSGLHVSAHPVNTVIRRRFWAFLGIIPVHFFRDYDGFEIAWIHFDEQDRAQRCGLTVEYLRPSRDSLEFGAKRWLAAADQKKSEHRL